MNRWNRIFCPRLTIEHDTIEVQQEIKSTEALFKGLKLVFVNRGNLSCLIDKDVLVNVQGPALYLVLNQKDTIYNHFYSPNVVIIHTTILMDIDSLEDNFSYDFAELLDRNDGNPIVVSCQAKKSLQMLMSQINDCPLQEPSRSFYQSAKALELVAFAIAQLISSRQADTIDDPLTHIEKLCVMKAHDKLKELRGNRISTKQLATDLGINSQRLSVGFRKIYGTSINNFQREIRLNEAYSMLTTGEHNVATVAYKVGYSPAHFSVMFNKRFGMCPSNIV